MRERITDLVVSEAGATVFKYWRSNGTFCTGNTYISDWVNGKFTLMRDIKELPADLTATKFLEISHSEIQSKPVGRTNTFHSIACGPKTTYSYEGRLGPGYHVKGNPWHIDGDEIQNCHNEAFNFFAAGCTEQEVLLANFGWELPEVRDLWPNFQKWISSRRKTLMGYTKEQAEITLAYNFGVAPLVGDVVKIIDTLSRLDKHVRWLRENSGQVVKVEFRKSLKNITFKSSEFPGRPSDTDNGIGSRTNELRAQYKAWANIRYDVSQLTDLQLKIRTLLRAWGFTNPAAVIWEAIPYSFVVDWFVSVSRLFQSLEISIKLPYEIINSGHGYWVESVIEDYFLTEGQWNTIRLTKTRGYARYPGIPVIISALSLDTPTAKQWVLGACLAVQKA